MANEIKIKAFTGMNNVEDSGEIFKKKGVARPRIILNADVTPTGHLSKRDGQTKILALTNGHSEWAGVTCHLVMDGTTLKQITGDTATTIEDIGGLVTPMHYSEVTDKVYLSNKYFNGIFDPDIGSISPWGIDVPDGPMCSATSGSLDAGVYHVCLTTESGGEISGNGPITEIILSATGGISISNRGADDIVWCTEPDDITFYRVGKTDVIANIPSIEPLPSLFCSPPPYVSYLAHAFGRMWGAVGNKVYYSEPFKWAWWKRGLFFKFATGVTMIAKSKTGLFVGCEDRTHFLLGTKPEEMQVLDVGAGAIPGTLAYCNNIIELGDTISPPEKKHESVPVWVSEEGIVAGNPVGRLFSLSQGKVKFSPGKEGASLYRQKNGEFQFLTSFFTGPDEDSFGMSDDVTVTVMRNGVVI